MRKSRTVVDEYFLKTFSQILISYMNKLSESDLTESPSKSCDLIHRKLSIFLIIQKDAFLIFLGKYYETNIFMGERYFVR